MATYEYQLTPRPRGERARELWLQHAAGFILFEDCRKYAIEQIDPKATAQVREAVLKGIDDALYGLMMVVDGVSGALSSRTDEVRLALLVRHVRRGKTGDDLLLTELDLAEGDGMCLGIHGWREGDFGEDPPAIRKGKASSKTASSSARRAGIERERDLMPRPKAQAKTKQVGRTKRSSGK